MFKKVAVSALAVVFFASPAVAFGLSAPYTPLSPDVQSQIEKLLAQIKQLQALIAELKGQTSSCDFTRTLTLGSKDTPAYSDVSRLQKYLIQKGYLSADSATGYYGFMTAQAVGKLQIALGIVSSESDPAYGFMGPKTRAAIGCAGSTNMTTTNPTPLTTYVPTTTYPSPSSEATCTLIPSSSGRVDNIGFARDAAQTADICKYNCINSLNNKWGYNATGSCIFTGTNGIGQAVMSVLSDKAPTSSEPKCTYTSNNNDQPDNVGFNNQSQTMEGCVASCTTVRNAKWGLSDTGYCHYTGANGVVQMQFIPAAPLSDVNFTVASSPTSITLAAGQSATDGPNGIRITLQTVFDSSGVSKASLMVKVSSAPNTGYYLSSSGETLGFADSTSPTGTIDVTISSISLQGKTVTLQIVAHTYPET